MRFPEGGGGPKVLNLGGARGGGAEILQEEVNKSLLQNAELGPGGGEAVEGTQGEQREWKGMGMVR